MSDTKISVTSEKPSVAGYESFDVFSGKPGLTREQYKESTFHASSDTEGDAVFKKKATLMEAAGDGAGLEAEASEGRTATEDEKEKHIED